MAVDHDFGDDLEFSHSCQDATWWEVVYRQCFPTYSAMHNVREDGPRQRLGVDRIVMLKGGRQIPIDEKARRKAYNDVALEFVSDAGRDTPGWVCKDLLCEYIAYAKVPLARCILLPTVPLQTAYQRYGGEWRKRYGTIKAPNYDKRTGRRWVTVSVCVPDDELLNAIKDALCASWAVKKAPPPPPRVNGTPPSFAYAHQGDLLIPRNRGPQ